MAVFQKRLLYLPDKNIATSEQYGLTGFREFFIRSVGNVKLQLWYKPATSDMPTILYFHGNASHIGNRAGIYSALSGKGFGVLALSYRGYGKSEGTPSEQGLYSDGRAALLFLTQELKIEPEKIIIYGESLGTGVSVQMACEHKIGGIILQAPYTSVVERASEIYFFLPVKLVMTEKFDSIRKIGKVECPILILHGELDDIIPASHGKKLFAAAKEPKEAIFFSDTGHNNFDSAAVASCVFEFAQKYSIHK